MKSCFFNLAFCVLFLHQLARLIMSIWGNFDDHTNLQLREDANTSTVDFFDFDFLITKFADMSSKEEHIERKITLDATCSASGGPKSMNKLSSIKKSFLLKHLIVSDKYKFLYCYAPKVACSNWKRVVMLLEGVANKYENDHPHGLKFLSEYSDEEIQYRLEHYYKFTFVRNPLERLLSAYRNKFGEVEDAMKTYGVKIKKKYGNLTNKEEFEGKIPGDDVSFEEFIRYIIDHKSPERMNEHWAPINTLCQPCIVNYDFIGSYDNLYEDSEEVLKDVKAPSDVHFPTRQTFYSPASYATTAYYYSLIKNTYMHALISQYLQDFHLFSYPFPKVESVSDE